MEWPLAFNPSGSARSEPKACQTKRYWDQNTGFIQTVQLEVELHIMSSSFVSLYVCPRPNLLTSVAPRCQGTVGSIVGLVPGVISLSPGEAVAGAHQGRHSKSAQYRRMKAEWKTNVYLARSGIQVR